RARARPSARVAGGSGAARPAAAAATTARAAAKAAGPYRAYERGEHEREDHDRQDEVHAGAREDDEEARPQRLERERLRRIVGDRLAALERVLLAHHLHVAAHRDQRQAVLRFLATPAQQDGTEADREALDADPGEARHD